jgi:hypothetical protein
MFYTDLKIALEFKEEYLMDLKPQYCAYWGLSKKLSEKVRTAGLEHVPSSGWNVL